MAEFNIENVPHGLSYRDFIGWHGKQGFGGGLSAPNERWALYKENGFHKLPKTAADTVSAPAGASRAAGGDRGVVAGGSARAPRNRDTRSENAPVAVVFAPQPEPRKVEKPAENAESVGESAPIAPKAEEERPALTSENAFAAGVEAYERLMRSLHSGFLGYIKARTEGAVVLSEEERGDLDRSGAVILQRMDRYGWFGRWGEFFAYGWGWCLLLLRWVGWKQQQAAKPQEEDVGPRSRDDAPQPEEQVPRSSAL